MTRAIAFILAIFAAAAGIAAPITFEPPSPDSSTHIVVTVAGYWPDGCVPREPRLIVTGSTMSILLTVPKGGGCTLAISSWRYQVRVGPPNPGLWTVRVLIDDSGRVTEHASRELYVREADPPFIVDPNGVPANIAGQEVAIVTPNIPQRLAPCGSSGCVLPEVRIDGVPVTDVRVITPWAIGVRLPPHAPGVADVTVTTPDRTLIGRAAIRFYDPAAPLDESLFEKILIPVSLNGPGAHGSQWRTEISARYYEMERTNYAFPSPLGPFRAASLGELPNDDRGFFFTPLRQHADRYAFSALIRDVSREEDRWGTELPIVREREFREGAVDFLDVPVDPRYRTTVRVYIVDRFGGLIPGSLHISLTPVVGTTTYSLSPITMTEPDDPRRPAFASVPNLRASLHSAVPSGRYTMRVWAPGFHTRLWAMVSVTNNTTQEVTIISPQ